MSRVPERAGCRRRPGPAGALVWLLLAALGAAAAPAGATALLDGELGRWLETEAAPALGETLSRHPRFRGETVRLAVVTPGAAEHGRSRLGQAVEARLRQLLLGYDGVRLAAERPRRACAPARPVAYLVRVELVPAGGRDLRVSVGVVDLAESVWVSGISHRWRGRISGAERRALGAAVAVTDPGGPGAPLPLAAPRDVAAALAEDLQCALPHGLEGALFVVVPDDAALARVALAVQSELQMTPLTVVTPDGDAAAWRLTLEATPATSDVRELILGLQETAGGRRQRVGAVFVSGAAPVAGAPTDPQSVPPARPEHRPAPPSGGPLLSALSLAPAAAEGVCDATRSRMNSCAEVSFELREPAYLFVVTTRDHRVVDAACERSPVRSDAGVRRYRLRVPPGRFALGDHTGPDAGLYVLATRERAAAVRLQRALGRLPGVCAHAGGGDWRRALADVLGDTGSELEWRALHLVHDSAGIVAL